MPAYIEMPSLSDTMTEGTLVKWLIKEGDKVEVGDEIAEIETDKATMAMPSYDEGVLHKILLKEGEKAPLGAKLGIILEEGEDPPSNEEIAAASGETGASVSPSANGAETPADADQATGTAPSAAASPAGSSRIKASPLARKIAAARGVNLTAVTGTGPGGRIVKKDVETAHAGGTAAAPATPTGKSRPAPAAITPTMSGEEDKRIPLTGMRTIIAERLLASKTQIPHFYLNVEVNAGPLMDLRKQINAATGEKGNKYTVNDFVLKAVVSAAAAVPQVNASFDGNAIIQYAGIHLCVAIAVEDGLVTPVITNAQDRSLLEISTAVKDLALRARDKKLTPDEFQGGTITVSNLGAYGIDSFDAIINPPQAAILSIGAIKAKPVVAESGEIVSGMRMWVGMSCDHRVVDGAVGATYLAEFRKLIESPALMLV